MNKLKILLVTTLLIFSNNFAFSEVYLPKVSVFGVAKEMKAPDVMNWSVNIESKEKDLQNLALKHIETSKKVLNFLRSSGIEKKTLKTSQMSFSESYNYVNSSRVKNGYEAKTSISFKLKDFTKYLDIWTGLSKFSSVSVSSVNFSLSNIEEIRESLTEKALLNAKDKAYKMSKTLGASLGEVIFVSDVSSLSNISVNRNARFESQTLTSSMDSIAIGELEIKAKVFVDFRIIE